MSALDTNVGASNYSEMKVQPFEHAAAMNATPTYLNVAKYISRTKADWREDIEKAKHVISLDEELFTGENASYFCRSYIRRICGVTFTCTRLIQDIEAQELINAFTEQFEDSDLIFLILYSLYRGDHDYALTYIKPLIISRENKESSGERI